MSVHGNQARISVRVTPGAARNKVVGFAEGILRIRIAAPPLKGKANRELEAFLSQRLGLGRGEVTIIRGHTSRDKTLTVYGLSQEKALKLLLQERSA
ncbi:MAG: DUF167 domain-containing protein [Dehalococcoidales bacterium]|nr:DUF167 domain-containing protein [Dehalococcoidales bacterium]